MEQWGCWEEQPNPNPHDGQNHNWNKHLPDLALTWTKNSLQNVTSFSPFQLVLGTNHKLPATLSDDLPALSIKPSSQIVQQNLNAIHSACAAVIASENSERIQRTLLNNVRTSSEVKYIAGDVILYKCNYSNEWGPGIVIGQLNQQVFVKHGCFYVKVHPVDYKL